MKPAEEILNAAIENYNSTANNMVKFQLNKRELEMFTDCMETYAQQVQGQQWVSVEDVKKLLDLQIDSCAANAAHCVTFDNNEIIPPLIFNQVNGTPRIEIPNQPPAEANKWETLSQKLKSITASTWRKKGDNKAIASSDGVWTGNQLADEIEAETERGIKMVEMMLNMTIDLLQRDKLAPNESPKVQPEDVKDINVPKIDYTFWKRLQMFISNVEVSDAMGHEEKEYIMATAKRNIEENSK